ncbi:MAG: hypothetical protein Tsb008_12270 [Rhodothalassiaceae bacterium]
MEFLSEPVHVAGVLFGLLLLIVLLMQFLFFARLKAMRERIETLRTEQEAMQKRLIKEIGLNSPTRAAIAAVMASSGEEPLDMAQFQKEIASLTQNWREIEELADKAHARLRDLVDQSGS